MNTLYVTPTARESRRAVHWLQEHDIHFVERNLFSSPLSEKELWDIQEQTHGLEKKKGGSPSLSTILHLFQAPLLIGEAIWIQGFDETEYQQNFKTQKR